MHSNRIPGCRILLVLAALLLAAAPAAGQRDGSIYLFDAVDRQLIRMTLDGSQETLPLDLPEDTFMSSNNLEFNRDGTRTAYCLPVASDQADQDGTPTRLQVVDLARGETLATTDFPANIGCRVTWLDGTDDTVAVSVIYRYSRAAEGADSTQPLWALLLVDATTGEIRHRLDSSSPPAETDSFLTENGLMMAVQRIADGQVHFWAQRWGTEPQPDPPAYVWDPEAGTLSASAETSRASLAALPATGESVWLELDDSRPAATTNNPVPRHNVIRYQPPEAPPQTIYHSGEWILLDVHFVDSGEALLVKMLQGTGDAADTPDAISTVTRWVRIDRDGTAEEVMRIDGFSQAAPAPDGFVLLQAPNAAPQQTTTAELLHYTDGGAEPLWTAPPDARPNRWRIVWHSPLSAAGDLPPFPPAG